MSEAPIVALSINFNPDGFWYVDVRREGEKRQRPSGRWVSLADAIAHVRNLERGAVKCE